MEVEDLMELNSYLDSMYAHGNPSPLHVFVVVPKVAAEELPAIAQVRKRSIKLEKTQSPKLLEFVMGIRSKRVKGWLVKDDPNWLFLIQPMESSREAGRVGATWIAGMFPALAPARINSDHLVKILGELEHLENSEVRVMSYVLHREGQTPEYQNTAKQWEYRKFEKKALLNYAKSARKLIESVRLKLMVNARTVFEASISRSAHLIFYSGNELGFSEFVRVLVARVSKYARDELKSFEGLEATEERDYRVSTLTYLSKQEEFHESVDDLVTALTKDASFSISIEHAGNPWYLLHAIDRDDGSSYDLHVFAHRCDVVPLTRASDLSIGRLTGRIEEVFATATRGQSQLA